MNTPDNGADGGRAADCGAGRGPSDQARLRQLAQEQAALRRVATLVARAAAPEEVFAAVAEEVGQLFPVDLATMCRYDSDRTLTFVASWGSVGKRFPVGSQGVLGGAQRRHGRLRNRPSGPDRPLCRARLGRARSPRP